jgi:hypothetical protein
MCAGVLVNERLPSQEDYVPLELGWALWRFVAIRGAGFPAALLSELAGTAAIAAIDRFRERESAYEHQSQRAIALLEQAIGPLSGDARKPLGKALRKLRTGHRPAPLSEVGPEIHEALAALDREHAAREAAGLEAERAYAEDAARIAAALRATAAEPRFREAVAWQNPGALATAVDRVRDGRASNPSQHRQHEQLVARYLQRYGSKNDTIGFFGPLGFGYLVRDPAAAHLRPGGELLSKRSVYFEHWAIIALADVASTDSELKLQLAPRINPMWRIEGERAHRGGAAPIVLPAEVIALLARCDGQRTASEVARHLLELGEYDFSDETDVYALLEDLESRGFVIWALEVPFDTEAPEDELRKSLEPLHGEMRDRMLNALELLEAGRARVRDAAGDAETLRHAISDLGTIFEQATGRSASRRSGENYAGRTLVFEDCRRDLDLALGPPFLAGFGHALSLVLGTARWFSYSAGEYVRGRIGEVMGRLGTASLVPIDVLFEQLPELALGLKTSERDVVGEIVATMDTHWREVLDLDDTASRVERSSAELGGKLGERFAAPHAGWPGARHHSVDLMVAADSFEQLASGGGLAVLAELHPGGVQLATPVFLRNAPWLKQLVHVFRQGLGAPAMMIPVPKKFANRTSCGPGFPAQFTLDVGMRRRTSSPHDRLRPSELVVARGPDGFVVRTLDGRAQFDAVAFCASWLVDAIANRFSIIRTVRHTPRITIDRLVVQRETWVVAPAELPFLSLERGWQQLAAARRWALALGLPRYVFVKIPEELKPVYVDLHSPLSIEMVAWLARRASKITISEMLPGLDELWLVDGSGAKYTCELRLAAVDTTWRVEP